MFLLQIYVGLASFLRLIITKSFSCNFPMTTITFQYILCICIYFLVCITLNKLPPTCKAKRSPYSYIFQAETLRGKCNTTISWVNGSFLALRGLKNKKKIEFLSRNGSFFLKEQRKFNNVFAQSVWQLHVITQLTSFCCWSWLSCYKNTFIIKK